ncbi:uncharacterized protein K02A2.6-like [Solenopsis invicta]|uniref:uncharacterized protein K02A2.6-like n=1 Tax=Solenopsis invicta TaxID=13686 RepID=UPI00059589A8|nr:uncharacterized protein K02A2.6-like [Solenopsis invicta]
MAEVVLHGNFSIDVFDPTTTEWKRWLQRFLAAIKIFKVSTEQQVLQRALRNQLVFGLSSLQAQSRLLETKDLTFEKAVQVATALELSEKDSRQLQTGTTAVVEYVGTQNDKSEDKGTRKKKPMREKTTFKGKNEPKRTAVGKHNVTQANTFTNANVVCFRCGGNHLANKCTRDRNIKCNYCGTPGHLRKVCMGAKRASANQIEEVLTAEHPNYRDKFFKTLTVDGKALRFEIDSGAAVSIHVLFRSSYYLWSNKSYRLVKDGILEKVNTSRWATPIVQVLKKNNRVRLCGDFSVTSNPNLVIDEHPLPTVDELFAAMAGGTKFTKIDLEQAYLQLEIREEDRELLTLSTHKGLFRSTRLMYGTASAPAIWQREIENILRDIPGVLVFLDDIKVTGPNDDMHLRRLEQVLLRLADKNIRINEEKYEFFKDSIDYCEYKIDKHGIHKTAEKMQAIEQMPRPRNVAELRSFLGMVNYYGRFIRNLSTILAPLHTLLQRETEYKWTQNFERAFQLAKTEFQNDTVLVHYDSKLPLVLVTDASAYDVGAVLSQQYPDSTERVLQYASQTNTQRKYAQIDREAYAIIFGFEKYNQCLYGHKFVLITDHRPDTPSRSNIEIQNYMATLTVYLVYPLRQRLLRSVDVYELEIMHSIPITTEQLAQATVKDAQLQNIIKALREKKEIPAKSRFKINQAAFSIQREVLLCNEKVVIPTVLRTRILRDLYRSHFGVVKMKALARSLYWWPELDKAIEEMARNCTKSTIDACKKIFSDFGTPKTMVMDNGRNFRSTEFTQFLESNGISPKYTAPYHLSTNGQAERVTPHCTTGVAPSEKMFNRKIHTYYNTCVLNKEKRFSNASINKGIREIAVGEKVQCRNYSGGSKWKQGIAQRIGKLHYKITLDDGRTWERHIDQILRSGEHQNICEESLNETDPNTPEADGGTVTLKEALQPPAEVRDRPSPGQGERSVRDRRPPERYTDLSWNQK